MYTNQPHPHALTISIHNFPLPPHTTSLPLKSPTNEVICFLNTILEFPGLLRQPRHLASLFPHGAPSPLLSFSSSFFDRDEFKRAVLFILDFLQKILSQPQVLLLVLRLVIVTARPCIVAVPYDVCRTGHGSGRPRHYQKTYVASDR